jgi:hypothetical protein
MMPMHTPEQKRILEWIAEAEHYKRINEMKPSYPMPEYVKQWCANLTEMSKNLKHVKYEN